MPPFFFLSWKSTLQAEFTFIASIVALKLLKMQSWQSKTIWFSSLLSNYIPSVINTIKIIHHLGLPAKVNDWTNWIFPERKNAWWMKAVEVGLYYPKGPSADTVPDPKLCPMSCFGLGKSSLLRPVKLAFLQALSTLHRHLVHPQKLFLTYWISVLLSSNKA